MSPLSERRCAPSISISNRNALAGEYWELAPENHPDVNVRGLIKEVMHPMAGKLKLVGSPLHFGKQFDHEPYHAAPLLGENTRDILEKTGFSPSQVDDWLDKGIVA